MRLIRCLAPLALGLMILAAAQPAKAIVLMRRNANSQNRQSKITDAMATPPSSVASPSRPIAMVETMPISGVVRLATIAGPAMAKTCAVVTLCGGANKVACAKITIRLDRIALLFFV